MFKLKNSLIVLTGLLALLVLLPRASLVNVAEQFVDSPNGKAQTPISEASSLYEASKAAVKPAPVDQIPADKPAVGTRVVTPQEVCMWSNSTNFPITILDQATVSQGGFLYTFGGVSTTIIANAYKFDGTTWTPIAPLPAALEFPTAVSDGTFIYILGGASTAGTPQTSVYRYDPVANTYSPMASFTTGTWNQAVAYLGGKIYKFAGTGPATASTNVLEIYDVATNMWSLGAPYPLAVSFVGAFVNAGFVYGAGGIQSVGSLPSLKTFRYDPAGDTWDDAAIADLPLTRWGAASSGTLYGAGANGGWVLAGGYVNGAATANISTSAIRWNPTANTWSSMPSMTGERSRMTGAQLGGSVYVIGGRSIASSGFVGTNSNQKLSCIENVAVINPGPVTITAESCGTPNGVPEPGETLTVALPLMNAGDIPTVALTATLQATGGVINPSAAQNYGAVPPDNMPVSRSFTFTVDPMLACGANITLTWTIADGATTYPNVTQTYTTGLRTVLLTEGFDGVTPPALPAGWVNTQTVGTGINWTTTATTPFSAPNAAFANDPASVNAAALSTPAVMITSADAQLMFKNKYITESTFDGCVLDFSTDSGATWTDVITGGGSFVSGGYNGLISSSFMNPLAGRMAWTGTSVGGYIDTLVNLPAALNGQSVMFRWMVGSDNSVAATGQWVDDVQIVGARVCQVCGGTCTSITCPANITVNTVPNTCSAPVTYPAPVTTGSCTVTCSPPSGSTFPKGTTTVTCSNTGGTPSCTFTITVVDNQPPSITCPANITTSNDPNQCGAVVTYPPPTITDNCPGMFTSTCVPPSGSFFPVGTTTVNCSIGQGCGTITQSASQVLTPGSVACNAGGFHTNNSYWRAFTLNAFGINNAFAVQSIDVGVELADANDAASPKSAPSISKAPKSSPSRGAPNATAQPITVRLWTSNQPFPMGFPGSLTMIGQTNTTVNDGTLAIVNIPVIGTAPAGSQLVVEVFTPDGRPPVNNRFFIGSNAAAQTGPSYLSAADCGVPNPTDLAALGFPTMHILMNVRGCETGGATCTFTVTVNDTQPPVITCPANVTAVTDQNACPSPACAVVNYPAPVASDNCPGVVVACNPPAGSCFPTGVTTVTCTATDTAGNTATCSFTVTVFDSALQDDSNPSIILLWNSITGQYRFCCNGITFTGVGKSTIQGCVYTLQHNPADRRVLGRVDKAVHAGSGSIQAPGGTIRCTITDRNTLNDTNLTSCQ